MTFIKKQINPNSTFEGKEDEDEDEFPLKLNLPNIFLFSQKPNWKYGKS